MLELTKPQREIRDFIADEVASGRPVPSQREIARHFGFSSKNAVACHLKALKAKGALVSERGNHRSLRVVSALDKFRGAVRQVPVFGSIPAGLPDDEQPMPEGCVSLDIKSLGYKPTASAVAIRVRGDSMIGRHILDGDLVIVEPQADARDNDIVAAHIDGKITLKSVVMRGGTPYLKPENPNYKKLIPQESLVVEGVVRAVIRRVRC